MLYTISRSPYFFDFFSLLSILKTNDHLVLFSDGVTCGINNSKFCNLLISYNLSIYAIKNDVVARGLNNLLYQGIEKINYYQFVNITEKNSKQIAW